MTLQLAQSYPSLAQRVQSVDQQSLKTLLTTGSGTPPSWRTFTSFRAIVVPCPL